MKIGFAAIGFGFALCVAGPAFAGGPDCTTDEDCPSGLECRTSTEFECVGWTDENGETHEECTEETVQACGPRSCTTDADCPAGLGCIDFSTDCLGEEEEVDCSPETVLLCGPKTCATDEDCAGGTSCLTCEDFYSAEECAEEFGGPPVCLPPYFAPCRADADCGPGFTCEPELECESTAPGEAEGDECQEVFPGRCELIGLPCTENADCAEGLVCERLEREICGDEGGPTTGGSRDEEQGGAGPGEEPIGEEECSTEEFSVCVPPDVFAWVVAAPGGAKGIGDELGEANGPGDDRSDAGTDGGGGGSSCSTAGAGLSLLGFLGVAFLLRRR
jgi:hypothetical protein